jgi:hypothetical protein
LFRVTVLLEVEAALFEIQNQIVNFREIGGKYRRKSQGMDKRCSNRKCKYEDHPAFQIGNS